MHFRRRNKSIQVIRTTYNAETKRAQNKVLGRMSSINPEISIDLRKSCTNDEINEIREWIKNHTQVESRARQVRIAHAAHTLPEQIHLAAKWFATQDAEHAKLLADDVIKEWSQLRSKLKKSGLLK